jgi:hypothetical protein
VADGGQIGRRRAIARCERPKIGVEPVADARLLGHQVLAGLDQELQLEGPVDEPDRRQVRLAQGHPGDGQRVTRIALAGPSRPDPFSPRELRWDLADDPAGRHQESGEGCPEARRALNADDRLLARLSRPLEERAMTGRVVVECLLGEDRAELVDVAGRQRRLVGIDPERCHGSSSCRVDTMGAGQAGSSASS